MRWSWVHDCFWRTLSMISGVLLDISGVISEGEQLLPRARICRAAAARWAALVLFDKYDAVDEVRSSRTFKKTWTGCA